VGPTATPVAPVDGALTVSAFEWGFEPEAVVVQQGEEVELALQNDGEIIHNLTIEPRVVEVVAQESSGGFEAATDELLVGADGGNVGTITFVPLEVGEYEMYCNIANHRQLGMEGRLVVE